MRCLLLMVLLTALSARAQTPPEVRTLVAHLSRGIRTTKVGDWVTYRLDGGGKRVHYWRLAAVAGEKDRLGRDALWLEIDLGTHPALAAPLAQLKLLVARDTGLTSRGISRLVVATGFDPPQEYSQEALASALNGPPARTPHVASQGVAPPPLIQSGRETQLMTHAGTVSAVPLELRFRHTVVERIWFSRSVPLLQLAKLELPGVGQALEVQAFGSDAKPRMALPASDAPKVRLEYLDAAFARLQGEGEGE